MILVAALVVCAGVAGFAALNDPHDLAGRFVPERMAVSGKPITHGMPPGEWVSHGHTSCGERYSPLDQITPANVGALEVAWTYRTGQVRNDDDPVETIDEVTPLVVGDTMFLCTPFSTVIALDPVTGAGKWRFDPLLRQPPKETQQHMTCRDVTHFDDTGLAPDGAATTAATEPAPD